MMVRVLRDGEVEELIEGELWVFWNFIIIIIVFVVEFDSNESNVVRHTLTSFITKLHFRVWITEE